jgi:Carboxypeptidase regulatory-like domain
VLRIGCPGLVSVFLLSATAAFACSCIDYPTRCGSIASAPVAFMGTVLEGTEPDDPAYHGLGASLAKVRIETDIKGIGPTVQDILVDPAVGTSCYFSMHAGERFLIVGGESDNVIHTSGCSGSRRISADDSTLAKIVESFVHGPNLVFGEARRYVGWDTKSRDDNFVSGVDLRLSRQKDRRSVRTDGSGIGAIRNLPPGQYQFTANAPGLVADPVPPVDVPVRGCVEVPVIVWPDQSISGTVRGPGGKPAAGVEVMAFLLREDGQLDMPGDYSATTDGQGRYRIGRLLSGDYLVGINAMGPDTDPLPMTFHPSATTGATARHVPVHEALVSGIDISIGPLRRPIKIQAKIVLEDGSPAEGATVMLTLRDGTLPFQVFSEDSNSQGLVTIPLYEGTEYVLDAFWYPHQENKGVEQESDEVHIVATQDALITLPMRPTSARAK